MNWQYRIIRNAKYPEYMAIHKAFYAIHKVFYGIEKDDDIGATEHPIDVGGESVDQLAKQLEQMKEALTLPILKEDEKGNFIEEEK